MRGAGFGSMLWIATFAAIAVSVMAKFIPLEPWSIAAIGFALMILLNAIFVPTEVSGIPRLRLPRR